MRGSFSILYFSVICVCVCVCIKLPSIIIKVIQWEK